MTADHRDYRGLGFDPVPGDPDAVADVSSRFTEAAGHAEAAEEDLRRAGRPPSGWTGAGAAAYAERLAGGPDALAATRAELVAAAGVLDDWAGTLAAGRRTAEELDRRAVELRGQVRDESDAMERAATEAEFSTGQAKADAEHELAAARRRHSTLTAELDRLLDEARQLRHRHRTEAERVTALLRSFVDGTEPASASTRFRPQTGALRDSAALGAGLATLLSPLHRWTGSPSPFTVPPPGGASAFAAAVADGGR
ncbi:hypothetical protein [Amycolatopsis nigrescens]|uniref:hypothetical protein n=1 Tax=Amycolatopsis nigrescens TaxID=381445 RepID=UPI000365F662|nr:hypothetical protein [Amycolatopsis nigrescens]